jgi:hypothetical protein
LLPSGDLGGLSLTFRPAEKVRLRSFTKTCLGEFLDCLARFSVCSCMSLTRLTYSWPYWSTARCTAPKDPRPISCLMMYWLMRCCATPSSSLVMYSECALSDSYPVISHQSPLWYKTSSNSHSDLYMPVRRGMSLVVSQGGAIRRPRPTHSTNQYPHKVIQ